MTEAGKALLKSFENSDNWDIGEHTAFHKITKIRIWITDGFFFFEGYQEDKMGLSLIDKWVCKRAFNKMRNKKIANILTKEV